MPHGTGATIKADPNIFYTVAQGPLDSSDDLDVSLAYLATAMFKIEHNLRRNR